jgi:hypothetical protein
MIQGATRWKFIPLLLLLPVMFFLLGIQWTVLALGIIILFLVLYDLMYVNFFSEEARRLSEIEKHMSVAEREQMTKLAWRTHGGWIWGVLVFCIGVPSFFVLGALIDIDGWDHPFTLAYYVLAFLVLAAVEFRIALAPKWRKPIYDFYYSTHYAREKGLSEEAGV